VVTGEAEEATGEAGEVPWESGQAFRPHRIQY
jgi:hypothetical protein